MVNCYIVYRFTLFRTKIFIIFIFLINVFISNFFFLLLRYKNNKMGGGLMQLVAYGAQDIYLTGSPQITFFKVVYRRHTNFAIESIEQTF
jgi:hypothetical protein